MPILFVILLIPFAVQAEVVLNSGSITKNANQIYDIRQEFGQTVGNNLFHSFEQFNLYEGEIAHFSGQDNIQNIITRVIGGETSFFDGTLSSSIPNADFYFFNPYGVIVGEHAQLAISGSFHLSTADYLKLGNDGEFHARYPERDILSVAPISSFGFLTDNPAPIIMIQGSGETLQNVAQVFFDETDDSVFTNAQLQLSEKQSISFIGGEISINGQYFYRTDEDRLNNQKTLLPSMYVPSGRLNLVGVGSAGEVSLHENGIELTNFNQLADIALNDTYIANVGMDGDIFIHAEQLYFNNSGVSSDDFLVKGDAGSIAIHTRGDVRLDQTFLSADASSEGNAGSISIDSQGEVNFIETALHADSFGAGEGDSGNITVQSQGNINFINSKLDFDNLGEGKAGGVVIKTAQDINFENVIISSNVQGRGSSGNIDIEAQGNINFNALQLSSNARGGSSGKLLLNTGKDLNINNSRLTFDSYGIGDAGDSAIYSQGNMNFTDAYISSSTLGAGNAGNITVSSQGDIDFIKNSYVFSVTYGQGHAGDIAIFANNLSFMNTTSVSSTSFGAKNVQGGNAGNISVQVNDLLNIAGSQKQDVGLPNGIFSNSAAQNIHRIAGRGGNIDIKASRLLLTDGGQIAVSSTAQQNGISQRGGDISIEANDIQLMGVNLHGENELGFGSGIYASSVGVTDNSGSAGNISIKAQRLLIKDGAVIESSTNSYADAGNINIELSEKLEISGHADESGLYDPLGQVQEDYLNNYVPETYNLSTSGIYSSSIGKTALAGKGGHINIRSPNITLDDRATISTSSYGGKDAGDISLFVQQLTLDNEAQISSASTLQNYFEGDFGAPEFTEGDIMEIITPDGTEIGLRYIVTSTGFNPIHPMFHVETEADLSTVRHAQHGSVAMVTSTQERFMLDGEFEWIRIREEAGIVKELDDSSAEFDQLQSRFFPSEQSIPYPEGALFLVNTKEGKQVHVYEITTLGFSDNVSYQGALEKINHFAIPAEAKDLAQLQNEFALIAGNTAVVMGETSTEYYYSGAEWIKIGKAQQFDTLRDLDVLPRPEPGFTFFNFGDNQETVFTGTEWIAMPNKFTVNTEQERNALAKQNGNFATINNTGESYFYLNNQWHQQVKGGNAGLIHIEAETIQLFNNAQITTESLSSGGGAIDLSVTKQIFLPENTEVTTSVKHGILNGGDLSITSPTFTILDAGKILAQAYEGNGGNIQVTTTGYFVSPDSIISASSEFGLDGHIQIDALGSLNNEAIGVLPNVFFDTDLQFNPSCNTGDGSRFSLTPNVGIANVALDWRSAHEEQ